MGELLGQWLSALHGRLPASARKQRTNGIGRPCSRSYTSLGQMPTACRYGKRLTLILASTQVSATSIRRFKGCKRRGSSPLTSSPMEPESREDAQGVTTRSRSKASRNSPVFVESSRKKQHETGTLNYVPLTWLRATQRLFFYIFWSCPRLHLKVINRVTQKRLNIHHLAAMMNYVDDSQISEKFMSHLTPRHRLFLG